MQDRYKYRVWDKNLKVMYPVWSLTPYGAVVDDLNIAKREISFNDCDVMQCTGLKDKDGKLIYEGDIVRINDKYPDYTAIDDFYKNQNFILEFFIPQAKYLMKPREYYDNSGSGIYELSPDLYEFLNWDVKGIEYGLLQGIEVMGNVYKNPELWRTNNDRT